MRVLFADFGRVYIKGYRLLVHGAYDRPIAQILCDKQRIYSRRAIFASATLLL